MNKIKGYQVYYDHAQENFLNRKLIPYFNPVVYSPCLENHVISELILTDQHQDCDYFGVLSWKFEKKHARSLTKLIEQVETDQEKIDVYTFFQLHTKPNVWQVAEKWHPGITEIAREIFKRMGKAQDFDTVRTPAVYQNAFLTRPEIYEDYVKNWLVPFMEILKHEDIKARCDIDTRYKSEKSKDRLKTIFGFPYYTLHPFLCERLFSTYLAYTNYKVKHIA